MINLYIYIYVCIALWFYQKNCIESQIHLIEALYFKGGSRSTLLLHKDVYKVLQLQLEMCKVNKKMQQFVCKIKLQQHLQTGM